MMQPGHENRPDGDPTGEDAPNRGRGPRTPGSGPDDRPPALDRELGASPTPVGR